MTNAATTAIVWSETYQDHDTDSHPESPERIVALGRALRAAGMFDDRSVLTPEPATINAILAVHAPQIVDLVQRAAQRGGAWLDPDTYVSPDSYEVALLAAGGACRAVDAVMTGEAQRAFAVVRPPGHHAEPDRSMGFCLFNNIAVAAEHALNAYGLERVAIVDWDVHHGNGTQAAFYRRPDVLFVSLHQYPFYPGSGAAAERGAGAGEGYTINIPLPAGSGDEVYATRFSDTVLPALHAFAPELILVSAGFDAHIDDPLAMMRVSTDAFAGWARHIKQAAATLCDGCLALILEGGYNLRALGESVVAVLRALDE
ncbi:MAG TPA: histone deacetylase [Thermomicrobiales bacterium]|nr:histone deacetylase [Thermomicrobiales bacterium]